MIMKCRKCDYEMELSEFLAYAEAYLIKTLVVATAIPLLIAMIRNAFSSPTKGFIDGTMSGLANNFAISCPNCKKADEPWFPASGKKPKKIKQKKENILTQ